MYSMYQHVGFVGTFPQIYIYVATGVYGSMFLLQAFLLLLRNWSPSGGLTKAHFAFPTTVCTECKSSYSSDYRTPGHVERVVPVVSHNITNAGRELDGTHYLPSSSCLCQQEHFKNHVIQLARTRPSVMCIKIKLPRRLEISPGQYIGLWLPTLNVSSFLQLHPFYPVSWSPDNPVELDLIVQPRSGLTSRMFELAENTRGINPSSAMITGPHGNEVLLHKYSYILLVASGFGVVAHLSCLSKLIHEHKRSPTFLHRVHLVWQLQTLGKRTW